LRKADPEISQHNLNWQHNCYIYSVKVPPKSLRYAKHTCNLAGFHILARNLHLQPNQI